MIQWFEELKLSLEEKLDNQGQKVEAMQHDLEEKVEAMQHDLEENLDKQGQKVEAMQHDVDAIRTNQFVMTKKLEYVDLTFDVLNP
eukprot:CAMPEP_0184288190 /NCGR_PEP_ID=MMETSP1049-20130417/686_1 /TAXON_ID=77928 /ORGANISM="Proteomonas sulcata, Strain CCMP704" /LENGTH=85 /DNA_ID=CAMNT_0026594427 /DNA_START=27 /DNA_END=280 /DNA_ORIENTATION=-